MLSPARNWVTPAETVIAPMVSAVESRRMRVRSTCSHNCWATLRAPSVGGLGQQHGELLAAIARHDVAALHRGLEDLGDGAQHAVAEHVAVGVVDLLEVIDVDEDETQGLAGVGECRDALVEPPPVQEPRQAVQQHFLAHAIELVAQLVDFAARGHQPHLQCVQRLLQVLRVLEHQCRPSRAGIPAASVASSRPKLERSR